MARRLQQAAPAFEKGPFGRILGAGHGRLVRLIRFVRPAEPAQQIGADDVEHVVPAQVQVVDQPQGRARAVDLGHRDRTVQRHHRGRLQRQQVRAQVVWSKHQGPVVPVLSVSRINGRFFAFVAVKEANGTFARQKGLTLGDVIGNDYVVLDGLKPGDHLIVSGTQFLQDGMPVAEQVQATDAAPAGKTPSGGAAR